MGGDTWRAFVKRAIEGEPDDPFVTMLKRAIEGGTQVLRVHLEETPKGIAYKLQVSRLKSLSTMEIPHSPSFTRWSLANGVKMASIDEEGRRFAVLAEERFGPLAEDLGEDYARAILVERLRALGPPRTAEALAGVRVTATAANQAQLRAMRLVDELLASLASDLATALGYAEGEVTEVLDGALERFTLKLFHRKVMHRVRLKANR